jgi:putative ABC transport system permease protein
LGDTFDVYIKTQAGSGQTLHVTIAGVVANSGAFAQAGNLVLISTHDYQAAAPNTTASYVTTTDQAHTDAAVKAINQQFPLASTQTVADALKTQQSSIDNINKFLEIAGVLALLIGGVGIVNTMQVLLSRRKTEIAMLKTTGYRRVDLYALFGLEAGMLGLIGGVVGAAAATGVSYIVRVLMQNLGITVPFLLDPWTIAGGVAIGVVTALIFGLMPIVQAANIRPLNVIRDLSESRGVSSVALTIALLVVLSVLFCALAIVILNNDVLLGIGAVYGTFAFLLVLSAFFGMVVLVVSKLPVPEHFTLKHLALILVGVAASALLYLALPVFGILLFAASLLGIVIVLLPRTWKVNTKMALRNIGRQRTRTTTTMLALFIGVFTVGLVLALGQDLQVQINNAFAQNLTYNVVTMTSGTDTTTLHAKLGTVPGLSKMRTDTFAQIVPTAINGQPLQQVLPAGSNRQSAIRFLSSMEGYNLSQDTPSSTIVQGRNLNASDAGTNNIVISDLLTSSVHSRCT